MPLDTLLIDRLLKLLAEIDDRASGDRAAAGSRSSKSHPAASPLAADAQRLWQRLTGFLDMNLAGPQADGAALHLACFALQLPARPSKGGAQAKPGRTNLRDRFEQAAELMVTHLGGELDETLLDRAVRILQEAPQRSPMLDEARLLADAVNLDDFGVIGLVTHAMQLAQQGEGVGELSLALEKREQYGYWDARLKDGFHFPAVCEIARKRLEEARKVGGMLKEELGG
jgi:hypothetical protein